MNKKEILRYISISMILLSFAGTLGIFMQVLFNFGSWISVPLTAIVLGLGLVATRKRSQISAFISSEISERNAVRLSIVYNVFAVALFLYPFALFIYYTLIGICDLIALSSSVVLLFYLLKFVDYQTIITPKTIESNIYSILFMTFSTIQLIILPIIYNSLIQELRSAAGIGSLALVIFTHGVWILKMREASPKEFETAHPKLYYDDMPYRGLFNIIAGFFLIGGLYGDFIFSPKSLDQLVLGIILTVLVSFIMLPYLQAFVTQRKFIVRIMTERKYRKLRAKLKKDKWEDEILSKSLVARFLNTIVWSILLFATFVGISTIYYGIFTGSYSHLIPTIILFSLIFTTLHYRISTRGERIQTFLTIFKDGKLSSYQIKRLSDLALIWYGICAGIIVSTLLFIRTSPLEKIVFIIEGFEITNLTLLAVFFVFTLIMIFYISFHLSREQVEKNRRALRALLLLVALTLIISINVVFYALLSPLTAAIFNSFAIILLVFLFLKATRNL